MRINPTQDYILNLKVKIKTLKDNLHYLENDEKKLKEDKKEIERLIRKYEKDIDFEMSK